MNNIVLFGPTQVGKSTLAGFMDSYFYPDDMFSRQVNRLKKQVSEMGLTFRKQMVLPSFVSVDKDEIRKFAGLNSIGTTKRVHRVHVTIPQFSGSDSGSVKCIFIDTPGTHAKTAERYRGIFEGDIGIYMINIMDVEKMDDSHSIGSEGWQADKERVKYLEPLQFWQVYKLNSPLLIVLSKTDYVSFDSRRIAKAITKVRDLVEFVFSTRDYPVIPIAISINEQGNKFIREGYNIIGNNISGYTDLITYLKKIRVHTESRKASGFAYIDKLTLTDVKDKFAPHYHALRVKVLEGNIRKGDKVILGPVIYMMNPVFITASVTSLKLERSSLTNTLSQGQIGGIILSNLVSIQGNKKKEEINYDKLKLLKTTVISTVPMTTGNCLSVSISKDETSSAEWQAICNMYPKEQISLFWFGRKLTIDLVGKEIREDEAILTMLPLTESVSTAIDCFAIAPRNSSSYDDNLDIALVIQGMSNRYDEEKNIIMRTIERYYIHARLVELIDMKDQNMSLRIEMESSEIKDELYSTYKIIEEKKNINTAKGERLIDDTEATTIIQYENKTISQMKYFLKYIRFLMRTYEVNTLSMTLEVYK